MAQRIVARRHRALPTQIPPLLPSRAERPRRGPRMISQVLLLTRWEWYKLSRRRIPWVLLVIAMIVPQAVLWGSFFAFRFESASRDPFVLPNSLTTGLSITHGVAVILIMVLSSSVVGSEYGWGTLRTALTKGTGPLAVPGIEGAVGDGPWLPVAADSVRDHRNQQRHCHLLHPGRRGMVYRREPVVRVWDNAGEGYCWLAPLHDAGFLLFGFDLIVRHRNPRLPWPTILWWN